MTLIVGALEMLEETVQSRLGRMDEEIKREFIEDFFRRIMNKYLGRIDSSNEDAFSN